MPLCFCSSYRFLRQVAIVCTVLALSGSHMDAAEPAPPAATGFDPVASLKAISVPPGFTVELAVASPIVGHPLMATFDERGRLFIAENAGVNLRPEELEAQLPNFIRLLEDTDGDGRFDKNTIFADKMTFPQGGVWHQGSLYVASPPNIWRLTDTDDDGKADQREVIVDKFGYNGNAADIHGCFKGPDGRIYWCDGRHGHEFRDAQGNISSQGKAARIFSCRPDGSDVRVHCGGGMDNPVEIDFLPNGDMLGTVNLLYRQRGDCLVHWLHGGVYPREDQVDALAEFKRTGDLLGPVYNFGHVAVSGTTRYRSQVFGAEYQNNFFVTEFNTGTVRRVILKPEGSSYTATSEEFFHSSAPDFHPTDVLEDADGSLLVIDTGGWFRIGCPTSQIAKPDIKGAIYRVRRADAKPVEDPRGEKLKWGTASTAELIERLGDPRFAVQQRAIDNLVLREDEVVSELDLYNLKPTNPQVALNAVMALTQIGTEKAQANVGDYFQSVHDVARQFAIYSAGQTQDPSRFTPEFLVSLVLKSDPVTARIAATSFSKLKKGPVFDLLEGLSEPVDAALEHAIIFALIEGDFDFNGRGMYLENPAERRGALIALDQMASNPLKPVDVWRALELPDARLQATAMEILTRRPAWAGEIVEMLRQRLTGEQKEDDFLHNNVLDVMLTLRTDERLQALVGELLAKAGLKPELQALLLKVISRSQLQPLPKSWEESLGRLLNDKSVAQNILAINTLSGTSCTAFDERVLALSEQENVPPEVRDTALILVARHGRELPDGRVAQLVSLLGDADPSLRLAAAGALSAAKLTAEQLALLLPAVAKSGPLELPALIEAFRIGTEAESGEQLLAALKQSPGLSSLSSRNLGEVLAGYPESIRTAASSLITASHVSSKDQEIKLAEMVPKLAGGDIARGKEVFISKQATCTACHRIEQQGGQIGPELTGIAKRRNHRDLVEAVLFPSASLARDFESYAIATSDGRIHTGLILRQTADSLILRTTQQAEVTIARSEIEELVPSPISIMPQGLERTMTEQQLKDLLAYLESLK